MFEILGGLAVATAVSGVVPLVNAELLVVGAAAALPAVGVPLVAVVSTVGQMVAKTSMFALARWAPTRLPEKARNALESSSRAIEQRSGAIRSLVFASAATGFPPFYGVSLASGALGMRLGHFVTSGFAGRLLRFGALAWLGRRFGAGALDLMSAAPAAALLGG